MFFYKEPDCFKGLPTKNLNGTIILGSTKKTDDLFLDDMVFDYENENNIFKWDKMMQNGINPLDEIKFQYPENTPVFDPHFLNSITLFLKYFTEEGVKVLNFILDGPLQNITMLNWHYIYEILLSPSNLPYTINAIAHSLFIMETENLHHKSIFLEMGGLSSLYQYGKISVFQNDLSLILKCLSVCKLSEFENNQYCPLNFEKDLNNSISYCSDSVEMEFEFNTKEDNEFSFCNFCESLLQSDDFTVRNNTFDALLSLTDYDTRNCDLISSIVTSHIDNIQYIEELIYSLKILANGLKASITPFISRLSDIISNFLKTADIQLIEAFCAFIENIIHREDTEYIWALGIVNKISKFLSEDSPFEFKKEALLIIIKIANACDLSTFKNIMSDKLLSCLIDFLDSDDENIIIGILNVIIKLINNWQNLSFIQDYLQMISSEADIFISLLNTDNADISNLSFYILSFIEFYTKD